MAARPLTGSPLLVCCEVCGCVCVCLFSRTQKCVTLSTTKAECEALGDTVKEAMFFWHVWRLFFPGFDATCVTVFEDNKGAKQLAQIELGT